MRDSGDLREDKKGGAERVRRHKSYAFGLLTPEFLDAFAHYLIQVLVFLRDMLWLPHIGSGKFAKKIKKREKKRAEKKVTEHFQWHEENYIHQPGIY